MFNRLFSQDLLFEFDFDRRLVANHHLGLFTRLTATAALNQEITCLPLEPLIVLYVEQFKREYKKRGQYDEHRADHAHRVGLDVQQEELKHECDEHIGGLGDCNLGGVLVLQGQIEEYLSHVGQQRGQNRVEQVHGQVFSLVGEVLVRHAELHEQNRRDHGQRQTDETHEYVVGCPVDFAHG